MVVKFPKSDKENIFDLNPTLRGFFPKITENEMRYIALIADALSPFRFKANKQELANRCLKNPVKKDLSREVKTYDEVLNPPKYKMLREMLGSYYKQFESINNTLKYADKTNAQSPEDTIKIQDQCNKIIKDKLDKMVWENIEFYESKLAYEYTPPSEVAEEFVEKKKRDVENADDISIDDL